VKISKRRIMSQATMKNKTPVEQPRMIPASYASKAGGIPLGNRTVKGNTDIGNVLTVSRPGLPRSNSR
jgi:hypothetical protein